MTEVRVGLIGVGSNGAGFLAAYHKHPGSVVVGLADPDEARRMAMAERYGVQQHSASAAELLRRPDVDLVSIHAPDPLHSELVLAALDAGKHVFVEKPLGTNVEQISAVIQRADASGKLVAVGQVLRTWPHFRRLKALVEQGRLGNLFYLSGHYLTNQMRVIPGIAEKAARSYSPGILTLGVHVVDVLRWLGGEMVEVQAVRNEGLALPESHFDACIAALFRFESGAVAHVATCWGDAAPLPPDYGVALHGSQATVSGTRIFWTRASDWTELAAAVPDSFPAGGPAAEVEAVIAHLQEGSPVPCDARDGGRSAIACLLAQEAARRGAALRIPLP